jgi:geranylgeranyl pyrophosphate synthase
LPRRNAVFWDIAMYPSSTATFRVHDDGGDQTSGFDSGLLKLLQPDTDAMTSRTEPAHAAHYHLAAGGQRIRYRFAHDAAQALGMRSGDAVCIATVAELLHNASLVHDDLQDRDRVRRGQPSVWVAFGEDVAICSGDLLLSAAYAALATFSRPVLLPKLIALIHARTARAISGQCDDLWAREQVAVELGDYERIAAAKSGALLGLPLELALAASGHDASCVDARRAADAFALGYQIADDITDFDRDAVTEIAGVDARPASFNIITILRAAGHDADAEQLARNLALKHLRIAVDAAADLPGRSGDLLRQSALSLAARL